MRYLYLPILGFLLFFLSGCGQTYIGRAAEEIFTDPQLLALVRAAENENEQEVKRLIASGVDVNQVSRFLHISSHPTEKEKYEIGMTPLIWLIKGRYDLSNIELLLKNGANPNQRIRIPVSGEVYETAVTLVADIGTIEQMALLLKYGGDPNSKGRGGTALIVAIGSRRGDMMRFLVENGADVNKTGKIPRTPIGRAASIGKYDYAWYLLENGADFDKDAKQGNGWLVFSVNSGLGDGTCWKALTQRELEWRGYEFPLPKGPIQHPDSVKAPPIGQNNNTKIRQQFTYVFPEQELSIKTKIEMFIHNAFLSVIDD